MIRAIAHNAIKVADMEKSLEFYCGAAGLKKAFEINDDSGKPWIVYLRVKNGQYIELFHNGARKPAANDKKAGFMHMCLEVGDIHKTASHLERNHVVIDVRPSQGKDFNYQCRARDPDGNRIEFMQLDPRSPQMNSNQI